jgi:CHAT domain/AAA domain
MLDQNLDPSSPYAVIRPAAPRAFVGYREGSESLYQVRDRLTAIDAGSPSYWIAGEPRSGKSSFLRKLEELLGNEPGRRGTRFRPVPLYVSCAEHGSSLALFRALLRPLAEAVPGRPRSAEPPAAVPPPGPFQLLAGDGPVNAQQLLPLLRADLAAAARGLDGNRSLFVLLIDDLDAAMSGRWGQRLSATLRALLTEPPAGCAGCDGLNVKLVVAGSPELRRVPQFEHLMRLLEVIKLRPLQLDEVGDLIRNAGRPFNGHLAAGILRATGGQPWLTQLVLDLFTATQRRETEFADWFKRFEWTRLRGDAGNRWLAEQWLSRLPDGGLAILAQLTLAPAGRTLQELAEATHLADAELAPKLEKMTGLGLIYQPQQRPDAYEVCGVVKRWYLETTGGAVFVDAIERQARSLPAALPAARPFSLLLSLDHRVMVADGLYTRCFGLDNRFTDEAQSLYRSARQATTAQHLADLGQRLENLGRNNVDENWRGTWEDYFDRTERQGIRFILQTGDQELLDFPIELLPFEQGFLGLRVPAFKEIIGLRRRQKPYRLAGACLPRDEPLNVLLVGAGAGGQCGDYVLPELPGVAPEILGICAALQSAAAKGSLSLGRIVVLSDTPGLAIAGAVVKEATVDGLRQALGGDYGFHVLHFSGHYGFGWTDQSSGLRLQGTGGVELFSLVDLFQQLDGKGLRLACFNGCNSGNHLSASPTHYLGAPYTCLRAGVPAVIGMRWPIDDLAARDLGIRFYQHLAEHGVPETALLETRKWAESRGGTLWAAPVMLTC